MTKLLKKAAMFSDIHFGRKNNSEEHNNDCTNFVEWFCEKVKADPEIDHIWFLGDWHEHRAAVHAFTLQKSYHAAKQLNDLGLPIYFIVGNHDMAARNRRTTYTTEHFDSLENFKLINEIQVIDEIYGKALAIPYLVEDEYPDLLNSADIPVALGHLELQGFVLTGEHTIKEHGPDAKHFFKNQKRVFSGHFHKRQNLGNIHYIGNTFPMDYSDANDEKRGMAVYDFYRDTLEYIDWKEGPRYITASLSDLLDDPESVMKQGARVRIDVDEELTYDESIQLRESLAKQYGLREITLDEKYSIDVVLSEAEEEIEELKLESTTQVIEALLSRIKDDSIDTDLLLEIFRRAKVDGTAGSLIATTTLFKDITIRNFLSYGNDESVVDLNFTDPTMILGKNYDSVVEGQVDSNGAGKSTILNALLMCLYGKNLVDAKMDQQINNANKKNMYIAVQFKSGDWCYKVERYRKNKPMGGDGIRVLRHTDFNFDDKLHDVTYDSVANAEAEVAKAVGIPYDMFIRIVVFSATHEPFLSLPSSHASKANQKDIIEELFGLTEITHRAETVKKELSDSKKDFKLLEEVNDRLVKEHERHRGQLADARHRMDAWEDDNAERSNVAQQQLSALQAIDVVPSLEGFEDSAKYREELVEIQKEIPVIETSIAHINSTAAKSIQWNNQIEEQKRKFEAERDELSKIDFEGFKEARDRLIEITAEIDSVKSELESKHKKKYAQFQTIVTSNESKLVSLRKEIEHLSDNKCPYCSQNYAEAEAKRKEKEAQVAEIEADNAEVKTVLKGYEDEIFPEYQGMITELESDLAEIEDMKIPSNLDILEANYKRAINWLETPSNLENPFSSDTSSLATLEADLKVKKEAEAKLKSKISMAEEFIHSSFKSLADVKAHQVRIESLEARIKEIRVETNPIVAVVRNLEQTKLEDLKTDEINKLDKLIKHQDFLVKLLTKKDSFIRKALLNKSIPLLNTRLRYYLDRVGLQHRVSFNEEMGVDISQYDAKYEYGQFSSGQKARVNICLAFAFRDVLQSRFGRTNLCILDECLDVGLGAIGVQLVAKMVKGIALDNQLSMFVISHKDEIASMFDRRLNIELRNGFSNIVGIS